MREHHNYHVMMFHGREVNTKRGERFSVSSFDTWNWREDSEGRVRNIDEESLLKSLLNVKQLCSYTFLHTSGKLSKHDFILLVKGSTYTSTKSAQNLNDTHELLQIYERCIRILHSLFQTQSVWNRIFFNKFSSEDGLTSFVEKLAQPSISAGKS